MRQAAPWLAPLTLLALGGAAAGLAFPAVLGRTVDQLVEGHDARGAVLLTAALVAVIALVDVASQLLAGIGTAGATGRLRREIAHRLLAAGPPLAQRTGEGDLVARLVGGTATAAKAVVVVSGLAAAALPPVGAVVALALIDPWLAATFAVGMASVSRPVRRYLRDAQAATAAYLEAQAAIATRLVEALAGARTIATARTTDQEITRVLRPLGDLQRHGQAMWRNLAKLAFRGEPVVLVTQIAVVAVAGLRMTAGQLSTGELLAASRYAVMAAGIGGIVDELSALTRARAAGQRLDDVAAQPVMAYGPRTLPTGAGRLELRDVTAGPPDGEPVLRHLDLVVPGGNVVAMVGASGTGKSLLAALAGRLCDPLAGEVRLDGVPLPDLAHHDLRQAVTYAFERPVLLRGTVAEAIRFGVASPPAERVRAAARTARADGFIVRLPDGYAAPLDTTPLSGGERQRLGLARAFAHDARLLILDDATSSLDTATEARIAAALTTHMDGRTRLIVTHREATAARADLVAWLDDGRIRACAPHAELLDHPGYQEIFGRELVGA